MGNMTNITILDSEYKKWVKDLALRYRKSQIKAAVKVNTEQLFFYLSLGKDIADRQVENKYGSNFYANLSRDLKEEIPGIEGLSETNIRYCKRFYLLYCEVIPNLPQAVEDLCSIPWGHHRQLIGDIGLLICKKKNSLLAQYSLESSSQPIAISSYELEKFYPVKIEGSIPTTEEIEAKLTERINKG